MLVLTDFSPELTDDGVKQAGEDFGGQINWWGLCLYGLGGLSVGVIFDGLVDR